MSSSVMKYFTLARTGDKIPAIAFGSGTKWQWKKRGRGEEFAGTLDEDLVEVVGNALKAGFKHLDTAETYTTRHEIGEAVKRSGIAREDLFITDKYNTGWNIGGVVNKAPSSGPYESLTTGLKDMNMKYIDLFLIHSPFFSPETTGIEVEQAWKEMERLVDEGYAKNIGVSNFDIPILEKVLSFCKYKPQVNQIEYHAYLQNQSENIIDFCRKHDILVEAYAPLTPILKHKVEEGPLDSLVAELTEKYKITATQLILRWVYETGVLPVTTSSNAERMKSILEIFNLDIDKKDIEKLTESGKTYHYRGFFQEYFSKHDPKN